MGSIQARLVTLIELSGVTSFIGKYTIVLVGTVPVMIKSKLVHRHRNAHKFFIRSYKTRALIMNVLL